jgi:hypothetical protein
MDEDRKAKPAWPSRCQSLLKRCSVSSGRRSSKSFVPNFSELAAPLYDMLRKPFNWDESTWTVQLSLNHGLPPPPNRRQVEHDTLALTFPRTAAMVERDCFWTEPIVLPHPTPHLHSPVRPYKHATTLRSLLHGKERTQMRKDISAAGCSAPAVARDRETQGQSGQLGTPPRIRLLRHGVHASPRWHQNHQPN